MDRMLDHRSQTAGGNRSKRPILRFVVDRSKKIIERRVPGIIAFKGGWNEFSQHHECDCDEDIESGSEAGKSLFHRGKDISDGPFEGRVRGL